MLIEDYKWVDNFRGEELLQWFNERIRWLNPCKIVQQISIY